MEGRDVGLVVQVNGPEQANQKLAEGWELLAVVPAQDANGQVCVAYVLGKPRPKVEEPGPVSLGIMRPSRVKPRR